MPIVRQSSFAAGELDPLLWGRPDLPVYQSGLAECTNWIPLSTGPITVRPGTRYCGTLEDDQLYAVLRAFTFSDGKTYVFEFGTNLIRLYYDGALVMDGDNPYKYQQVIQGEEGEPDLPLDIFLIGPNCVLNTAQSGDTIVITNYEVGTANILEPWLLTYAAPAGEGLPPTLTMDEYPFVSTLDAPSNLDFAEEPATTDTDPDHPPQPIAWKVTSLFDSGQSLPTAELTTPGGLVVCYPDRAAIQLTWTAASGANGYLIYKGLYGSWGLAGYSQGSTWADQGVEPNLGIPPPRVYWNNSNECAAVCFAQQRLCFGAVPQRVLLSEIGDFQNFDTAGATYDDAPLDIKIASAQYSYIYHLAQLGRAIVALTSRSEWAISPNEVGNWNPPNVQLLSSNGANPLAIPAVVNNRLLYSTPTSNVRDLAFSQESGGLSGNDISLTARHIFERNTIVEMAWQADQNILWIVLDDGRLVSCTYLPEAQMAAWATHETEGRVVGVTVAHEDNQDHPYLLVERDNLLVGFAGGTKISVERLLPDDWEEPWEAVHLDNAVTFDGRSLDGSEVDIYAYYDKGTYGEATIPDLTVNDVGDYLVLGYQTEDEVRLLITGITEGGNAIFYNEIDMPEAYRGGSFSDWAWARKSFIATDDPWGAAPPRLSVMADGNYIGISLSVGGEVDLVEHAVVVHVGQAYDATAETLDISEAQGDARTRQKLVSRCLVEVLDTPYLAAKPSDRPDEPSSTPLIPVNLDEELTALQLQSGVFHVRDATTWNTSGKFQVVQDKPFPATVTAIYREVSLGGTR